MAERFTYGGVYLPGAAVVVKTFFSKHTTCSQVSLGKSNLSACMDILAENKTIMDQNDLGVLLERNDKLTIESECFNDKRSILQVPVACRQAHRFSGKTEKALQETKKSASMARRANLTKEVDSVTGITEISAKESLLNMPLPPVAVPLDSFLSGKAATGWTSSQISNTVAEVSTLSDVDVGPIRWGEDIESEFRGLLELMPSARSVSRIIRARRTSRPGIITVHFPTTLDAASFINCWETDVPKGFESVFVGGNRLES